MPFFLEAKIKNEGLRSYFGSSVRVSRGISIDPAKANRIEEEILKEIDFKKVRFQGKRTAPPVRGIDKAGFRRCPSPVGQYAFHETVRIAYLKAYLLEINFYQDFLLDPVCFGRITGCHCGNEGKRTEVRWKSFDLDLRLKKKSSINWPGASGSQANTYTNKLSYNVAEGETLFTLGASCGT